ncbi:MAG: hypothetical protein JEZ07_01480 [Phycisphaerae bacterium]|nr:hypothetical protein [Phycisphaerae bacterium]
MRNAKLMCLLMCLLMSSVALAVAPVSDGLIKHVDASSITGLNDGDKVASWPDLAGIQDVGVAAEDNQPIYIANGLGGLPSVRFDGVNDYLNAWNTTNSVISGDTPFHIFVVCDLDTYGTGGSCSRSLAAMGTTTGTRATTILAFESATTVGNRLYGGWPHWTVPTIPLETKMLVHSSYASGGQSQYGLALDGTTISPGIFNNDDTHAFQISTIRIGGPAPGVSINEGTVWDGDISEVLIYNRVLSSVEINRIGYYLTEKYGLTTTHTDPGPFVALGFPTEGKTDVDPDAATFTWNGFNTVNTPSYDLYYGPVTDPNENKITTADNTVTTTLAIGAEFVWKVAMNDGANTYWSATKTFTTSGKTDTPAPADGATSIGQDTDLLWRDLGLANLEYIVHFGTDEVNLTSYDPQSEVTFDPGDLDPNTTYYWSVDSTRDGAVVEGDVWSFTTGGMATNPLPGDASRGAGTMTKLTWTGDATGEYINEYDVYAGSTANPTYVATVTEPEYQITTELAEDTTYYWKVIPKHDGQEVYPGFQPVWSFTTGELLGYWPLDADGTDAFGSQNATLVHKTGTTTDPNFDPGVIGNAATFFGTELFSINNSAHWADTGQGLTIACWAKWNIGDGYPDAFRYGPLVSKNNGTGPATGWALQFNSWYNRTQLIAGGNTTTANEGLFSIGDVWHYHVVTYSPLGRQYFVDGVLHRDYVGLAPFDLDESKVQIGGRVLIDGTWNKGFKGSIDDLRIYSRPLSEPQALDLYLNSPMAKLPDPAVGEEAAPFEGILSWTAGVGANIDGQKLYYGTEADLSDATVVDLAADATTYDIPGYLDALQTYYWRVDSTDGTEVAWTGTRWSFRVGKLDSDIVVDNVVETADLAALTGNWLADTNSIPTETDEVRIKWTEYPNANLYFIPRLTVYNYSWIEVNDAPVGDENYTPEVTQTVQWHLDYDESEYDGHNQCEANFRFMEPIDLANYQTLTLWIKPHGMTPSYKTMTNWWQDETGNTFSSGTRTPLLADGTPIAKWSDVNDQWVRLVYNVSGFTDVHNFTDMELWLGRSSTTDCYFELGEIVLTPKSGLAEAYCWDTNYAAGDINEDCIVDLNDFVIMSNQWLMDLN